MHKWLWNPIRKNLTIGVIVIIPIIVTVYFIQLFWKLIDTPLRALFIPPEPGDKGTIATLARFLYRHFGDLSGLAKPGVGIIVAFLTLYFVGLLARSLVGKYFVGFGDMVLGKIPIVRTLYLASKQLLQALLGEGEGSFREVVLVEYPKKNSYCIGFLASRGKGELATVNMEPIVYVFVPTTPNPTSGLLLLVPESRVKRLNMSIEDAVRLIISSGISASDEKGLGPTLFETPTTKFPVAAPPEGIHPDVRKALEAVKKEGAEADKKDPDD